jgi:hypothetical protein
MYRLFLDHVEVEVTRLASIMDAVHIDGDIAEETTA